MDGRVREYLVQCSLGCDLREIAGRGAFEDVFVELDEHLIGKGRRNKPASFFHGAALMPPQHLRNILRR